MDLTPVLPDLVLNGLGVPAVLLLRSANGRPTPGDRSAQEELRDLAG